MIALPTTWGQWVAALVALFLVPAAGSAFWEFFAKPLVLGTTDRIRNVAMRSVTLGSQHAETRLFEAVGRRALLHPAVAFWRTAYAVGACAVGFVLGHVFKDPHVQPAQGRLYAGFIVAGAFAFAILSMYRYFWTSLVDHYIRRFDYYMELTGPLMSEQERLIMRANFAAVNSAKTYNDVIDAQRKIMRSRKLTTTSDVGYTAPSTDEGI